MTESNTSERSKMMLSRETSEEIRITGMPIILNRLSVQLTVYMLLYSEVIRGDD